MKWIKCSDQMPLLGELVIASCGTYVREGYIQKEDLGSKKKPHIVYSWVLGCEYCDVGNPTSFKEVKYWMPLPEPPIDEKNASWKTIGPIRYLAAKEDE